MVAFSLDFYSQHVNSDRFLRLTINFLEIKRFVDILLFDVILRVLVASSYQTNVNENQQKPHIEQNIQQKMK